jgi:hypothetical protein
VTLVPILNGIYVDTVADFRTSYPRNMVPVPKKTGIAEGFLRPGDGIVSMGTGPGIDRGGFNWNGVCFRVMGTKLVTVAPDGAVTVLGDVGPGGPVTMDNGFDRLAIWSGGKLFYWNGTTLQQVTDSDLGTVIDGMWIAGYFLSTDGTSLIVTELNDPLAVNPLKYGSAEADPDPVLAVDELRNEAYAAGRYSWEVFENVGGDLFPFQRLDGAHVARGVIGTHAYAKFLETFAFLGSGRNEAPAVYLMGAGSTQKLSTAEVDKILATYTEAQLSQVVVESRVDKGHNRLMIHLPDVCWVYDAAASQVVGEPVWYSLDSGTGTQATYRARNLTWCYDKWIVGDPTSSNIGTLVDSVSTHYGADVGWDFGTLVIYNEGRGAIFTTLELIALPGRVPLGADPTIWASYSLDGETWSQERPVRVGGQGERGKRLQWRLNGRMRNYRIQRFRGTSAAHLSIARLEAELEPLYG